MRITTITTRKYEMDIVEAVENLQETVKRRKEVIHVDEKTFERIMSRLTRHTDDCYTLDGIRIVPHADMEVGDAIIYCKEI